MRYIFLVFLSAVSFAQQTSKVDFIDLKGLIEPNYNDKTISGFIIYNFTVKSAIDTIRIDAKNIDFSKVLINNKEVKFTYNAKELKLFEGFALGKNTVSFNYKATPKQTLYYIGEGDNLQIWTQGQGKYTSHWLPSFDDVNEKVIFNLSVVCNSKFNVISNGKLDNVAPPKNNSQVWNFSMKKPMSSYLVMLAIGKFDKKAGTSNSGIPLEWYYSQADMAKVEPTYRYSKQMFDFLEKEIGVKYPWGIYRQVPVRDFLYGGMENTTATIFAQDYVTDPVGFNDRNYVNVNAHELAHQWFGDMVTAKSGKHHWLQEGFATYYALLVEKEIFGDDYFYHQIYKTSLQLRNAAKTDTIPVMNERASSLSFYQKGAWALHSIREAIGEKAFNKAVKAYLKKYQFKNVETDDFLAEIKKVSNFDTDNFKKVWLEDYHYPVEEVNRLLEKNTFIQRLFDVQKYKSKSFSEKEIYFTKTIKSDAYFPVKTEIIYQIANVPFAEKQKLLDLAMQSNTLEVRRSIANTFVKVPVEFQSQYESLLNDDSYYTKEVALSSLWDSFPEEREKYLETAKNWEGNNDKSLRIQYLTLSQSSKVLTSDAKGKGYQELQNYTSSNFESSIRQNATDAILSINPKDEIMLKNLINAILHFKWQFSKYAKDQIRVLLKKNEMRLVFEKILPELNPNDQIQLKKLM